MDGNQFTFYDNYGNIILSSFDGFEYPVVRDSVEDVSGKKSAYHQNSLFGKREISFTGDLIGSTVFTLRRSMLDYLGMGSLKLLKFTTYDDLLLQCEGELDAIVNPYNHSVHTFKLSFVCPDWRFFSQTLNEFTTIPTTIHGGASIPTDIPMDMGGISMLTNSVLNAGNEVADPIFTIHGPGSDFRIINQMTGDEFLITQILTSSELIIINFKDGSIAYNGDSILNSITGDIWQLAPGDNDIGFFVNGSGANTLLTINWRNAYNGI